MISRESVKDFVRIDVTQYKDGQYSTLLTGLFNMDVKEAKRVCRSFRRLYPQATTMTIYATAGEPRLVYSWSRCTGKWTFNVRSTAC